MYIVHSTYLFFRGVSEGGAGGAIAPPLFGRIEGAAGGGATPHYYVYYYLPPHFYEATYAPARGHNATSLQLSEKTFPAVEPRQKV